MIIRNLGFLSQGGVEFSAEAQAVFDNLPNALTETEKEGIATFVDASVISGNWDLYDYFFGYFLNDETNALTDWRTGLLSTAVSAPTHTANQGFLFNGTTQYIDTEVNLSTDSTNYVQNAANIGGYCYENNDLTKAVHTLFFVQVSAQSSGVFGEFSSSRLRFSSNTNASAAVYSGASSILSATRYFVRRTNAQQFLYIAGSSVSTDSDASSTSANRNVFVGAYNITPVPLHFFDGEISHFFTGGNFDITEQNSELDQLESDFII